jgi:hypothetical protein
MSLQLRVSVRSAFIITFWIALWCANLTLIDWYEALGLGLDLATYGIYFGLVLTPPAAVMGIICGRQRTGILCGLASTVAYMLMWQFA